MNNIAYGTTLQRISKLWSARRWRPERTVSIVILLFLGTRQDAIRLAIVNVWSCDT